MTALSRLSLTNRLLAALITVLVIATGIIATLSIRQELMPDLEMPQAMVSVSAPGSSPEVMEQEVVVPLETAVQQVDDVEQVEATATNGMAMLFVLIDFDADADAAVDEVQQAVAAESGTLPDNAETEVMTGGNEDIPVLSLAASADEDEGTLSTNVQEHVLPELEGLPGVRDVQLFGQREELVEIDPDEDELEEHGLSTADITQALQDTATILPGGSLTEDGQRALSVDVTRELADLDDLADVHLMPATAAGPAELAGPEAAPDGGPEPVRLGEVADIDWVTEDESTLSRVNGAEAMSLIVYKDQDANTVEVAEEIRTAVPDLADDLGDDGELLVVLDTAPFIEDSIDGLVEKGLAGLVIAIALILAFLLSVRTTIVTAVSIPLSLLIAMTALWFGGYTLNIMTLAALTVAIGRVVDDSIVVLENVKRHLSYGGERMAAILAGVREVAGAITASTLTTVAVFLPVGLLGGMIGEMFRPFGITIAVALLASLLVSLTIIPVLAYWFVRSTPVPPQDQERVRREIQERERRSWMQRAYVPVLRSATVRGGGLVPTWRRWTTLAAGLLVFVVTIGLATGLRFTFLEDDDQNQLIVQQELQAATAMEVTDDRARDVEELLDGMDEVRSYETTVGGDGMGGVRENQASYFVIIDPEADIPAVRQDLEERLEGLEDAGELDVATMMGGPAGGEADLGVQVLASDGADLEEGTQRVSAMLEDVDGLGEISSDLAEEEPGIEVRPREEEAAEHGLSVADISQAASASFDGQPVGTSQIGGSERSLVLANSQTAPQSLEELREIEIPTATGTVELDEVAVVEEVERPVEIVRSDGERSVTVSAVPEGADLGAVTAEVTTELDQLELPAGVTAQLAGQADDLAEAQEDMLLAMLASIALVFLIMVATFRSLAQPLILLVSVPFAATGAIAALLVTDTAMSMPAMIGLLMLIGIVVTNAIVLIDLINQYRERGMPLQEAVIEGGRQRLRPIIMTALATVGALVPMALGLGTGSVFVAQSLALVVIGGLVTSTVLTLLILPALYMMLEEGKERRAERRARRRARRRGEPAVDGAGDPDPGDGSDGGPGDSPGDGPGEDRRGPASDRDSGSGGGQSDLEPAGH
ncbi:efflux RND transporter permease subunit [Lipingzhangella sp. LS1_29]|uniref:Efflux RND transporter permease subunit n=1 Tax=Lipingzhangella rawalii TaxID=2055835 RepID=A0ABU2H4Q4_9ACTN|nr:efflux RND transporter permease subunit [Lipingzhangella rawalii]MDS1270280.1 efflux RND transporter permease subunit [Lipingzhangella rawalii]